MTLADNVLLATFSNKPMKANVNVKSLYKEVGGTKVRLKKYFFMIFTFESLRYHLSPFARSAKQKAIIFIRREILISKHDIRGKKYKM